mmetsp:Transcript_3988/g.25114  ORF Transcript_3988/g.25114 Transcript_3988/m.25114 type:complete len:288 (-) Transcript_3988:104-967(-)
MCVWWKEQPHRGKKQTERCIESQIRGQGPEGPAKHLLALRKGRHPPPIFLTDRLQSCKPMTKATCTSLERCTERSDPLCSQKCTLAIVQQPAMLQRRRAEEDTADDFYGFILLRLAWVLLLGTLASVLRHLSRFPLLPIPLEGRGSATLLRHLLAPRVRSCRFLARVGPTPLSLGPATPRIRKPHAVRSADRPNSCTFFRTARVAFPWPAAAAVPPVPRALLGGSRWAGVSPSSPSPRQPGTKARATHASCPRVAPCWIFRTLPPFSSRVGPSRARARSQRTTHALS